MEKFVVSIDRCESFNILVEANDEKEAENIVNKKAREGVFDNWHTDIEYGGAYAVSTINGIIKKEGK